MRRWTIPALLPAVLLTALALGGCGSDSSDSSDSSDDQAAEDRGGALSIPTGSSPSTSPDPASPNESTAPSATAPTADLQPCDLLDTADMTSLGVAMLGPDDVGGARICEWQRSGHYYVAVGIWEELTIDQVRSTGPKQPTTIRGRDAVRFLGGVASCGYALDVSGTSRVDVISSADGDVALGCRTARKVAVMIEHALP